MCASFPGESPEQLGLPFKLQEEVLHDHLQQTLGKKIFLTITDNSTSMISSGLRGDVISLRLHRMFLSADIGVINEIAKFVRHRGCKTPLIRKYIRENSSLLKARSPRIVGVKTKGRHHDLAAVFSSLNACYFEGRISAGITWGTRKRGRAVRLRTLGSYSGHTHMIRINPLLDARSVPKYFLEFVVYHEMLHADLGTEKRNGRRVVHSRAFREKERQFADYARALAWERRWTGRDRA